MAAASSGLNSGNRRRSFDAFSILSNRSHWLKNSSNACDACGDSSKRRTAFSRPAWVRNSPFAAEFSSI